SKRLSDLVVNVLKLNKLEHSNVAADLKEFDLAEELRACILDFEEVIDNKNLQLDCDIDEICLYSDKSLLETVWHNLISNAVKFTPEGGSIAVSLKNENGLAVVSVSDTGCGIASGTGEHIFDKFFQGDTSHAQEGNGLGLAMVKRVIDILGGEISVSSKVGEGSTFTVKLKGLK
ncbi:MAG: HAMP domain-containing histidine kinase, partial [Clostridia bacterium]|nr:HAMP domain-containing histidine kinase [Clostridia bacterium]